MLRFFTAIAILCSTMIASMASEPAWLDEKMRMTMWPASEYYVGLWTQEVAGNLEQSCSEARRSARAEVTKSIVNNVDVVTETRLSSLDGDDGFSESESFHSRAVERASATLVNVATEVYVHPDGSMVTAVARIGRKELSDYNVTALRRMLFEATEAFDAVKQTYASGDKKLAQEKGAEIGKMYADAQVCINMINAIGIERTLGEELYSKITQLHHNIERFLNDADQSIKVFVNSIEHLGAKKVSIISGKIKDTLSNSGCEIVGSADGADYVVSLSATTRRSDLVSSDDVVYVFADVDVELYQTAKDKALYTSEFSRKGGGLNAERAGRKALESIGKELSKIISEKIK